MKHHKDLNEGGEKHLITAYANDWAINPVAGKPVEVHSIEEQKDRLVTASDNLIQDTRNIMSDSMGWLPHFAEHYNISANLKDYVIVPVTIMPSDLPNKNAQAFPLEELVRADVTGSKALAYESWTRSPCYIDHKNDDHTKAKGVILSSIMKPMKGSKGNLWKVICLCAFDRRTHPIISHKILTGEYDNYSMGAMASYFTCSICGEHHTSKVQNCEHVNAKAPRLKLMPDDKLAYLQSRHIQGFETSVISSKPVKGTGGGGAYYTAVVDPSKHLK